MELGRGEWEVPAGWMLTAQLNLMVDSTVIVSGGWVTWTGGVGRRPAYEEDEVAFRN